MRIRHTAALLVLAACVVLSGCGGENGSSSSVDASVPRAYLELAPVVADSPAPCPPGSETLTPRQLPGIGEQNGLCFTLEPPIVTGANVRSSTAQPTPVTPPTPADLDWGAQVILDGDGIKALNDWTVKHVGSRLAIVAEGQVVRVAIVNANPYSGTVIVTGLSKDDALRYASKASQQG